jgi:hypothetical protein
VEEDLQGPEFNPQHTKEKQKEKIQLIHCKNLCKCHNVPSPITIKEKEIKKK